MAKPEKRVVVNAKGKQVVYWYARWYDPQGKAQSKTFSGEQAFARCKAHLTSMESARANGTYVDGNRGKITVGAFGETRFTGAILKPSTRERYAGILRTHIYPRWGTTRLADVSHSDIQTWVSGLWNHGSGSAAVTVRKSTACSASS